jgi:hypothetical protein
MKMNDVIRGLVVIFILGFITGCSEPETTEQTEKVGASESAGQAAPEADANDNRVSVGHATSDGLLVELTAQKASWRPQEDMAAVVDVYAFGESTNYPRPIHSGTRWRDPRAAHHKHCETG